MSQTKSWKKDRESEENESRMEVQHPRPNRKVEDSVYDPTNISSIQSLLEVVRLSGQ